MATLSPALISTSIPCRIWSSSPGPATIWETDAALMSTVTISPVPRRLAVGLLWGWIMACFHGSALAATGFLLVLGGSLSAAYGMHLEQRWVALLEQRLAVRWPGLGVVNASVSGEPRA